MPIGEPAVRGDSTSSRRVGAVLVGLSTCAPRCHRDADHIKRCPHIPSASRISGDSPTPSAARRRDASAWGEMNEYWSVRSTTSSPTASGSSWSVRRLGELRLDLPQVLCGKPMIGVVL